MVSWCRKASAASEHAFVLTLHLTIIVHSGLYCCPFCRGYRVCMCARAITDCTLYDRPKDVRDCSAVPEEASPTTFFAFLATFFAFLAHCFCLRFSTCVCVCMCVLLLF